MQTNGIFELRIKNAEGKEGVWTIDLKQTGSIYKGPAKSKPNVTILVSDDTFQQLAEGKVRVVPIMRSLLRLTYSSTCRLRARRRI
jgi:hypothetical protein